MVTLCIVTLLAISSIIFAKHRWLMTISLCGAILFLSIAYFHWFESKSIQTNLPFDQNVEFVGIVDDEPDVKDTNTNLTIKVTESVDSNILKQKVLVRVSNYPQYQYGDKLQIAGSLQNPGQVTDFDYKGYLQTKGINSSIINTTSVKLIEGRHGNRLYSGLFSLKDYYLNIINKILPEPMAGLLAGLLLGMRRGLPENLLAAFNNAGLTHIIAISGFNITIIIKSFENLTISWPRNSTFGLGILILFGFVIITGANASVVRAALMASTFLLAKRLGRKGHIVIAATLVACIMIALNPYILRHDIGFQLSFLSTLGLIYASPIISRLIGYWPKIIGEPLSATLGAQLATMPIILYNFGRVSIIAPLANILILPIIPLTMLIGFIASLFGTIILPLGQLIGYCDWLLLKYIIVIAEFCSRIPLASLNINLYQWYIVLLYYCSLVIFIKILTRELYKGR